MRIWRPYNLSLYSCAAEAQFYFLFIPLWARFPITCCGAREEEAGDSSPAAYHRLAHQTGSRNVTAFDHHILSIITSDIGDKTISILFKPLSGIIHPHLIYGTAFRIGICRIHHNRIFFIEAHEKHRGAIV